MFESSIYDNETVRTNAALYGCSMCPPPEGCPDDPTDPWNPIPIDREVRWA